MDFNGKTVIISGGASGMGRLHATQLASQGATVAVLDVQEDLLNEIATRSRNIIPYVCDVTDLTQVRHVVADVMDKYGSIDRLINCAAIMPGGLLMNSSAELLNKISTVNYCGMINFCQTVIPHMLEQNSGDVIIYGSIAGMMPSRKFGGYGTSKAANNFYAKVLIKETRQSELRVLLVCPPAVDTPLLRQLADGPGFLKHPLLMKFLTTTPEKVVAVVEKRIEKGGGICYPGVARMIAFLVRFM